MKTNGLYKRPNSPYWYARFEMDGIKYRESTKTTSIPKANRRRDEMINVVISARGTESGFVEKSWEGFCQDALEAKRSWLRQFCWSMNKRNREGFNVSHRIDKQGLYALARSTNGRCAVTGIKFRFDGHKLSEGPYAMSIDRIKPGKPYSLKNCRFVLRAVNYAMHNWGEEAFLDITRATVGMMLLTNGIEM